jgi:hypothetical protein
MTFGMLALGVLATATLAFGAAQLVPEHQHRIGTCPGGGECAWDCGGSQCEFGFGAQICENDVDCPISCLPGPICDGGTRAPCTLPLIASFPGRLVVRVDENDALCAPFGTGCNQTTDDDCGSKVTVALRARTPSATEVAVSKDIDLCTSGALACSQTGDCDQCLDGSPSTSNCPRPDPVFLCNGQGQTDITEADIDVFGSFTSWLNDMQPFDFLRGSLPPELQTGIPMVLAAAQTASGKFCSGTVPRTACTDDSECGNGESCYAEAEYCVTLGLIRGRCIGGTNEGTLCVADGECDSGNCGIAGVPDIGPFPDDTDVSVADLGTCGGGCPSSPDAACVDSFEKCLLLVDESKPGKEKLAVSWRKGPAIAGSDFGNPLAPGGTAYDVCAYDASGVLAGQWEINRAGATCGNKPCWKVLGKPPGDPGHKGYRYKDPDATTQGIQSVLLKGDEPGKSKLAVKGKNNSDKGQTSLPTGVAAAFTGSATATIQLRGSDAPQCFTCAVTTSKDEGGKFKATQ